MAKPMVLTPDYISEIRASFEEALKLIKLSDGKINFTKSFASLDRKATIYFSELAWLKMQTLIREFSSEVGWHGIAKRGNDPEKDEYIIEDILIYPQEVTGTTVTTDQVKYQMWLMSHEDDVFDNIRMQGHSHVDMGVTPSGVDTSFYDGILAQLTDDMFYIFMIWNKKGDKTIKIYDLAKNIFFDTSDCTVEVLDDGLGVKSFLEIAKDNVQKKVFVTSIKTEINKVDAEKKESASETPAPKSKKGKKKGKRKKNSLPSGDRYYKLYNSPYDEDEKDDPYGPFGYSDSGWNYTNRW